MADRYAPPEKALKPVPSTDVEILGGANPDLATATVSHSVTSTDFKFSHIHLYPGGSANDSALDELRIGTSYTSVTPLRDTAIDPTAGAVSVARPAGQGDESGIRCDPTQVCCLIARYCPTRIVGMSCLQSNDRQR